MRIKISPKILIFIVFYNIIYSTYVWSGGETWNDTSWNLKYCVLSRLLSSINILKYEFGKNFEYIWGFIFTIFHPFYHTLHIPPDEALPFSQLNVNWMELERLLNGIGMSFSHLFSTFSHLYVDWMAQIYPVFFHCLTIFLLTLKTNFDTNI